MNENGEFTYSEDKSGDKVAHKMISQKGICNRVGRRFVRNITVILTERRVKGRNLRIKLCLTNLLC